ncbi:hypothetical protein [Actinophytocola sp.]|uniref:hypothetical protein n=1 Tax=Actinophytocola sp. TaxID=1872138 RepID=UPI002ED0F978
MDLPPGCDPIPVDGIDPETNPRMAKAAGELNAWIEYLLRPETHDGPRVYRPLRSPHPSEKDTEVASRTVPDAPHEDPREYETLSVLEDFASDPGRFFRPAQAVSGINTLTIEPVYLKLVDGYLTWIREGAPVMPEGEANDTDKPQQRPAALMKYRDVTVTRINWVGMRKSWVAREDVWAHAYEGDLLDYQMRTENCLYAVAEHVIRYRAILHRAGEDILALTEALTRLCPRPAPTVESTFNLMSVVVTGIVAVATSVITGGSTGVTAAVLFASAVEMVGEAVKTTERTTTKELVLENTYHLRDAAKQYLNGVEQIEREVADALVDLTDSLRRRLDQIREARQYSRYNESQLTDKVPFYDDYRRA